MVRHHPIGQTRYPNRDSLPDMFSIVLCTFIVTSQLCGISVLVKHGNNVRKMLLSKLKVEACVTSTFHRQMVFEGLNFRSSYIQALLEICMGGISNKVRGQETTDVS